MDLASVVAALASVGVRVSGSAPNSSVQVDSSRACPPGLAGPEPSGTIHDLGQHFPNERADLEKCKRTIYAQEEERQKKQKSECGTALLDSATSAPLQAQTGRRTSVVWTAFTEDGEDSGFARCVLHRANGVCGIGIKHCSGTRNLRAHLMAHHKEWFIQETEKKCDMQDKLVANGTGAIELQTTPKWTAQKIHLSNRKRSYWLCRRKLAVQKKTGLSALLQDEFEE